MNMRMVLLVLASVLGANVFGSEPMKLSTLFSDGAVLQRGKPVPVWGTTTPQAFVRAAIGEYEAFARASKTGRFMLNLPPMKAGGPYKLTVSRVDCETQDESVTLNDIYIGEVWVASGQSNMEYRLGDNWAYVTKATLCTDQKNAYLSQIKNPATIRAITVPKTAGGVTEEMFDGEWKEMNAENALKTSATALWFAHYLREKLGVPVGLIVSAWGGTRVESWTSLKGLLSNPDTKGVESWHDYSSAFESARILWRKGKAAPGIPRPKDGFDLGFAASDLDDSGWKNMTIPGSWVQQKIAGCGAIWVRRKVSLPASWVGKDVTLEIDGVDKQDSTYVNNKEVGFTGLVCKGFDLESYAVKRRYQLPKGLLRAGENTIAIRAASWIFDGSIALNKDGGCRLVLKETGEKIDLAGTWKAKAEYELDTSARLYDSMISPLIPYAMRGVIWYQGEANADFEADALLYKGAMQTLIRSWRDEWGQGDFPFIQVQLAAFHAPHDYADNEFWPILRDAQRRACQGIDNVYMATAVDIGDARDVHPQDKKSVGYRLSRVALNEVYGFKEITPFGPLIEGATAAGNRVILTFKNTSGMFFKGIDPRGFFVAGSDGKFVRSTDATIKGETITLSAPGVKKPVAVRYSWADNPNGNLYNDANLPASPFHIDVE